MPILRYRKECLNRVYKAIKELNKAQELASKDLDDVLATRIDEHRLSLIRIYNGFGRRSEGIPYYGNYSSG